MLRLYGGARSRASIVQWYIEELGIPYEFVQLDMQVGEHRQPNFLAVNPVGKVPAIADGEFTLWESGAILLYLADKYGKEPLSVENRALLNQWISYANATLGPEVFGEATREKAFPRHMTVLNQLLTDQPYLLGDEFSAADVAVGALLAYIHLMLKLEMTAYPAVVAYGQRLSERPAFQKSIGGRK
ncbi:MAG: glutathione S-transferase family protein [Oscillatoriales cyanobacterium C42_A2020_001]|nr:glutathione S-transferase family protein [Leptolyngbyaceae cyanobacterium C42_A2020_001]